MLKNAEYYLRDASGNEIGILDLNNGKWEWYAFGRERFSRLEPADNQQPPFYESDYGFTDGTIDDGGGAGSALQKVKEELDRFKNEGLEFPDRMLEVRYGDGRKEVRMKKRLEQEEQANPNMEYEILRNERIGSEKHLLALETVDNNTHRISVGDIAKSGTGSSGNYMGVIDTTVFVDSTFNLPDYNTYANTVLSGHESFP